jgi:polysaccharide pyruvyl transferase WcaK-like protein
MIGHGGFSNRGCEAIVASTSSLLKARYSDARIVLASFDAVNDCKYPPVVDEIDRHFARRWSLDWDLWQILRRLGRTRQAYDCRYRCLAAVIAEADVILSIGGDNYCYDYPGDLLALDAIIRRQPKPLILWGASVDAQKVPPDVLADLKSFDYITARESLTIQSLAAAGICDNVIATADPAFTLKPQEFNMTPYVLGAENGVVGVNFSPLISHMNAGTNDETYITMLSSLVREIVDTHHMGVLLVPQVMRFMNDDRVFLSGLLGRVDRPANVRLLPSGLSAAQTKYAISKCRMFIGARTHTTIAAMSSLVPTITIGYSLKGEGIPLDVYGRQGFTIDSRSMTTDGLAASFQLMLSQEAFIQTRLAYIIPHLQQRAAQAVDVMRPFLRGDA